MLYGVLGRPVLALRSAYRSHNTLSSYSWTISMDTSLFVDHLNGHILIRGPYILSTREPETLSLRGYACKLSISTEQFTIEVCARSQCL